MGPTLNLLTIEAPLSLYGTTATIQSTYLVSFQNLHSNMIFMCEVQTIEGSIKV